MASFIAIPLKKTSEVDLVKPLKYVFSGFCVSADEPINYDDALNELNKLRMNSTWRTLDKHENSLDVMTRYYDQLSFLSAKCPGVEFQVSFKWKDAFDKGSFFLGSASLTMPTLDFERTCMMFNIAAMQSQVACSHISDTKNDDGLKLAAKYFQMSSGTFLEVRSQTKSIPEPTPDLRAETLSALSSLMLAQAQEAFFFKATRDNMKDGIVAKVASRAEELYSDALKLMQKEAVVHLWERDWVQIVSGKQAGFLAVSEYYQSLVCKANKDVGEEIARLQKALDALKTAEAKGVLPDEFKEYQPKMTHNYNEAKKDNDFIYHARVPDSISLPPIGKAPLAKPFFPGPQTNSESQDLFSNLLPIVVQQAMSAFELRKMEIVNGEKAKLQSETQMLNGILASLNLPAALEDSSGTSLPQSLKEKAQAIKAKGGIEVIQQLLHELPDLLQRNNEILNEIESNLRDEEESDNELRSKYGPRWQRTPSAKLNDSLKENMKKYRHIVGTATSADSIVREKYEKHRDKISLLCLPEDQILSGVPAGSPVALSASAEQLRRLMRETDALRAQREALISELESPTTDMKAKFLAALSNEGGVNESALSVEMLGEIYGPIQQRVVENLSKQERLIKEIQDANNEFSKEKNNGGSASKRESLLRDLAVAHDAYMELIGNLEEGSKFYNNLTEVLVAFQNKINDFCFARKTEKEELSKDIQKNIVVAANQPTPLAPPHHSAVTGPPKPARPPPPATSTNPAMNPSPPYPQAPQNYPPPDAASNPMAQQNPPYPSYPYPYPVAPNPYNPYGQIVMQPYPPAPGYQGQPQMQHPAYPYPPTSGPAYPYPQQQYRPWPQ